MRSNLHSKNAIERLRNLVLNALSLMRICVLL